LPLQLDELGELKDAYLEAIEVHPIGVWKKVFEQQLFLVDRPEHIESALDGRSDTTHEDELDTLQRS
jgi:hypothetical protein